jgi:hypothetical protein
MVPKKNGKIQKCQDFQKLNVVTRKDYFPPPFINSMVNVVAQHECYSFLDGFLRSYQISIMVEDRSKNHLHHIFGHICILKDAFWFMQFTSNFPKNNDDHI